MRSPYYPKMWFGTFSHMQWIDCPLRGADMSPSGWGSDGTYLSGGGYAFGSPDSHRDYMFEWRGSSSIEDAQIVHAYRDGVYSDTPHDLIYFQDPNNLQRNILPKRWANPSLNLGSSGFASSLVKDQAPFGPVDPVTTTPSRVESNKVPRRGVRVLGSRFTPSRLPTKPARGAVFIPVQPRSGPQGPESSANALRVMVNGSGMSSNNGVYYRVVNSDGSLGPSTRVITVSGNWTYALVGVGSTQIRGVLIYTLGSGFDLYALDVRYLYLNGSPVLPISVQNHTWEQGEGHSGCTFVGNPTFINTSGVDGGQVSYGVTLKETGDWLL